MALYVLDTSAVLAVLKEELENERVVDVLRRAERGSDEVLLPFVVSMEVRYKLLRESMIATTLTESDVTHWLGVVQAWPIRRIESDLEWGEEASNIKARGRISLADAWVAALALRHDAVLVHKDPEFDAVQDLRHLRLPYDRDGGVRS